MNPNTAKQMEHTPSVSEIYYDPETGMPESAIEDIAVLVDTIPDDGVRASILEEIRSCTKRIVTSRTLTNADKDYKKRAFLFTKDAQDAREEFKDSYVNVVNSNVELFEAIIKYHEVGQEAAIEISKFPYIAEGIFGEEYRFFKKIKDSGPPPTEDECLTVFTFEPAVRKGLAQQTGIFGAFRNPVYEETTRKEVNASEASRIWSGYGYVCALYNQDTISNLAELSNHMSDYQMTDHLHHQMRRLRNLYQKPEHINKPHSLLNAQYKLLKELDKSTFSKLYLHDKNDISQADEAQQALYRGTLAARDQIQTSFSELSILNWIAYSRLKKAGYNFDDEQPKSSTDSLSLDAHVPGNLEDHAKPETKNLYPEYAASLRELLTGYEAIQVPLLSSKQLKELGFKDVYARLIKGESDGAGTQLFSGTSKSNAKNIVSFLHELYTASHEADPERARTLFSERITAHDTFNTSLEVLLAEAREILSKEDYHALNTRIANTNDVPFFPTLEEVKTNWSYYRRCAAGMYSVPSAVESIEQLLFLERDLQTWQPEEAEAETEEPVIEAIEEYTEDILSPEEERASLIGVAEQLEEIILPTDATEQDVKNAVQGLTGEAYAQIDWKRLQNLVKLRTQYGGKLYRSNSGDLGGAPPYFVSVIDFFGRQCAIAECPVEGNATYIVDEARVSASWIEILQFSKADARQLGAVRVIHRGDNSTDRHIQKVEDKLLDLATV